MIYGKISQEEFDAAERAYENCGKPPESLAPKETAQKRGKLRRGDFLALFVALICLIAGAFFSDTAVLFLSISLLLWILKDHLRDARGMEELRKSMRAFSIMLFFGAILLCIL